MSDPGTEPASAPPPPAPSGSPDSASSAGGETGGPNATGTGTAPARRRRRRRRSGGARPATTDANGNADAAPAEVDPNRRTDTGDGHDDEAGPGEAEPGNRIDDGDDTPGANAADGTGAAKKRRRRSRRRKRSGANANANADAGGEGGPGPIGAVDDVEPASEAARALSESLQAAVLGHTSGAVLARGRGYVKRNRVSELRVSAGRIRARVLGSDGQRYRVELTAPQTPPPPVVTKIRWSCDCLYAAEHRRGTCKHVVAVTLVAAKRIARADPLRRRWLGGAAAEAPEADPAEFTALAERMLAAFTSPPANVDDVLARAFAIAPPPFSVREPRS